MKYLDSWASTFLRHFAREPGQERAFFVGRPQLGNPKWYFSRIKTFQFFVVRRSPAAHICINKVADRQGCA